MANWSNPTLSSLYTDFLTNVKDRDIDAATMFKDAPSNQPTGAIRYERVDYKLQEWNGSSWVDRPLGVTGGGTGSTTASGARTFLGIGTMGTQNSDAVTITGGTLSGITSLTLSGNLLFGTDVSYNIGSNAAKANKAYIGGALVVPVGTDKWATS